MQQELNLAVILDTELTGLHEPDVIQLAAKGPMEFKDWHKADATVLYFRPRKPISIGAMATHRIIMEDLEQHPTWTGRFDLPLDVGYLVGHGVDIDWAAIGAPPHIKRIDTLALARRYWPDLDSYRLVALIFHLVAPPVAREMTVNAHCASVDITLTEFVLDNLLDDINRGNAMNPVDSWEQLWQLSEQARIPLRIGFSKYGPKNGQPGTLYSEVPLGMLRWICDPVRINDMDPWEVKAAQRQIALRG